MDEHSIHGLCKVAGVSRSGYYSYLSRAKSVRSDEKLVIDMFHEKKGRYGIRRLKMHFERETNSKINLKKIIRIKKQYNLTTKVRKRNLYKMAFKKGEEHKVAPNILERNFNPLSSETCLSTDVTELRYGRGQRAYLSATKNLRTKEIVNFRVSAKATLDLVVDSFDDYLRSLSPKEKSKTMVHSDQGFHYTSFQFRALLDQHGVLQSMSRKGNCLDNSPIESFFGHLKDEVEYRDCKNVSEVRKRIDKYIDYYNNKRPQWGLKKKTPAEARVKL